VTSCCLRFYFFPDRAVCNLYSGIFNHNKNL
jgi:hypothetical protein